MFFIVSAPFQHDKGVSYNNMVLHIRCDAKLYFKSIKTMVTMLKIMVTMLILLIKLPRASFFRRRTATPINNFSKTLLN